MRIVAEEGNLEEFLALHKGLGYCWSVAVVALPSVSHALMKKWP